MIEVASNSREIQDYYSGVTMKSSEDISPEPVRGQEIEKRAVTDFFPRNSVNRPSLTSGAAPVAEERQETSSKTR